MELTPEELKEKGFATEPAISLAQMVAQAQIAKLRRLGWKSWDEVCETLKAKDDYLEEFRQAMNKEWNTLREIAVSDARSSALKEVFGEIEKQFPDWLLPNNYNYRWYQDLKARMVLHD